MYVPMLVRDGDVAGPIPEPGTLVLAGLSLIILFSSRRRRK